MSNSLSLTSHAPYRAEVVPGVHAYVQPDGGWYLNNAGFLVGEQSVLLIDQVGSETRARALLAEVSKTAPGLSIRTAVNTHHHGDHTYGNCVLPNSVSVVSTAQARQLMSDTGVEPGLLDQHLRDPDTGLPPVWGELQLRLPDVTITNPVSLWNDEIEVRLIPIPTPAHTSGDLVVWLPEERVLFTGDLVFQDGTPLAAQGSIEGWLEALNLIEALAPNVVVPGHGPITDASAFSRTARYLRWIQERATEGHAAGMTPLDLARSTDLEDFASLTDPERIVPNLHRAYLEIEGAPRGAALPSAEMMRQMKDYHGGALTCRC